MSAEAPKFKFGDRIKIYNMGCFGGCTGTFIEYSGGGAIVTLDNPPNVTRIETSLGEMEFSLNMIEAAGEES